MTTLSFRPVNNAAAKAAVMALCRELDNVIAHGHVSALLVDGVPMRIDEADTPHGKLYAHPTDPSLDRHTAHPPGLAHSGEYTYTLVPVP